MAALKLHSPSRATKPGGLKAAHHLKVNRFIDGPQQDTGNLSQPFSGEHEESYQSGKAYEQNQNDEVPQPSEQKPQPMLMAEEKQEVLGNQHAYMKAGKRDITE